jgi:formate dehydrogenase major subunit
MTRRTALGRLGDSDLLEMHPDDATGLGLRSADIARVISRHGSVDLTVRISDRPARGNVFTSFHFPQALVNALLSDSADLLTKCPEYKVLAVRVQKSPEHPILRPQDVSAKQEIGDGVGDDARAEAARGYQQAADHQAVDECRRPHLHVDE